MYDCCQTDKAHCCICHKYFIQWHLKSCSLKEMLIIEQRHYFWKKIDGSLGTWKIALKGNVLLLIIEQRHYFWKKSDGLLIKITSKYCSENAYMYKEMFVRELKHSSWEINDGSQAVNQIFWVSPMTLHFACYNIKWVHIHVWCERGRG